MNGEISPVYAPASSQTARAEDLERTTQGDDKRVAPVRQASDADKLREAAQRSADEQRRKFQDKLARDQRYNADLDIERYRPTGEFVYHIIERETGEQLRQWPREDLLKLSERFKDFSGTLYDEAV